MIGIPREALVAEPRIQWRHVDGPLLMWAGHLHWLTWRERLALWLGRATPETLAQKHWPLRIRHASQ